MQGGTQNEALSRGRGGEYNGSHRPSPGTRVGLPLRISLLFWLEGNPIEKLAHPGISFPLEQLPQIIRQSRVFGPLSFDSVEGRPECFLVDDIPEGKCHNDTVTDVDIHQ